MKAPLSARLRGRASAHRAKATGDHPFDADLLDEAASVVEACGEEAVERGIPFASKDQEIRFHMLGVCQGNLAAAKDAYEWVMATSSPQSSHPDR